MEDKSQELVTHAAHQEVIVWEPIGKLVPHPKNPNVHPKEQIVRLAEIIKFQGWRHPIIVSNQSGFIAAGHGRLMAAEILGCQVVPVHYQDFESTDQEYAFMVSDNAIAEWASLDLGKVNAELPELGIPNIDLLGIQNFTVDPSETGMPDLPSGEKGEYQQMTFALHNDQVEQVKAALVRSKELGPFDAQNENSNGNALARICETFVTLLEARKERPVGE